MRETNRRRHIPRWSRAAGAALTAFLVTGATAAGIAGCVREHPADAPVPGVRCEGGICLVERPDQRSSTFALAPDCWLSGTSRAEAGINAERMTLIGDGEEIVFAAMNATNADLTASPPRLAIARFDGDPACPRMDWPDLPEPVRVPNGAHLAGPEGRFWSFFGDAWGTRGALAFDRTSGWVAYATASPAPADDVANWNAPNALAITLPGGSVAILRSVASNDPTGTDQIPTTLEKWTFGADGAPAWAAQTQISWDAPGYAAMQSMRGQVRLFPDDDTGDRLVVLGDAGRAAALTVGDPTPLPLGARPADPDVKRPNLGSASVMLPLRPGSTYAPGSVLYIGGGSDGGDDPGRAQRLDLFDPATGIWTPTGVELPHGRTFATPVLLPDGSILLAGDKHGSRDVLYIDPTDFSATIGHGTLSRGRGMGVGGLVLADGRLVLAGGTQPEGDAERAPPDVDVWEPSYLRAGPAARAVIESVPGPITADGRFTIQQAPGGPAVTEVVLLAYGSSFMGNNPNQRLVELVIDRDGSEPVSRLIALIGPPAAWAPPGRYLLFALTADRIPSAGIPVDVVAGAALPALRD